MDLVTTIGKVKFKHCYREANEAAHVIARFSYCNKLSLSWTNEPPGWLVDSLVNDVTIVDG